MKKVKKYWMVVLQAGLLMATLVGTAGARLDQSPQAGALSRRITIPAGHFIPHDEDDLYNNQGVYMTSETDGSAEYFTAPVVFPTGQAVVVESITLYAYDNNGSDDVCLDLYVTDPTAGSELEMTAVCSTGSSSTNPRHFTDTSISGNPVKHGKGVYFWLEIEDNTDLKFYGVRIQYHHGTT
jgi:hypothetical protein